MAFASRFLFWTFLVTSCACTNASGLNLLANGDFASGISGWTPFLCAGCAGSVAWSSDDAQSQPDSGSIELNILSTDPGPLATQCISVTPGITYSYGGKSRTASGNNLEIFFSCKASSTADCGGSFTDLSAPTMSATSAWQASSIDGVLPVNAHSVQCSVQAINSTLGNLGSAHLDDLFFNDTDFIFANGFDPVTL